MLRGCQPSESGAPPDPPKTPSITTSLLLSLYNSFVLRVLINKEVLSPKKNEIRAGGPGRSCVQVPALLFPTQLKLISICWVFQTFQAHK